MSMPSRRSVTGVGPVVSVEKIPAQPIPPPVETTPGKPVTGLSQVRLLHNLIVPTEDGKSKLIPRGETVNIETVPEKWRTSEYVESPTAFREGKVQLLHDMSFAMPTYDGERTVWRERLFPAHSLVDLTTFPNRIVEGMIEGEDFLSQWDEDDRKVKEIERQNSVEEFSMDDPVIPDDISDGRNVPLRYSKPL